MATWTAKLRRRLDSARRQAAASKPIRRSWVSAFLFYLRPFGPASPGRFRLGRIPLCARYADRVALDEIALRDEYGFIDALLDGTPRPVVADLGANVGLFSIRVFHRAPRAVVHAVEAAPGAYRILEKNRNANPGLAWTLHHAAVWSEDGEIGFAENASASTASAVSLDAPRVRAVRLRTLLAAIGAPVDLLKIDIEGAEEAALCTDPGVLDGVEAAIVEVHPHRCNAQAVVRTLNTAFPHLYRVGNRASGKPLLVASRRPLDLPVYASPGGECHAV